MMDLSIKEEILERLKEVKSFQQVSMEQYSARCPLCGDSKKDLNKKRFYVKINMSDDSPIVYHCFNCESGGLLTPDVLRRFQINDLYLNSKLLHYNKESINSIRRRYNIRNEKLNIKVPTPKYSKLNMIKKRYIELRLGISFTFEELVKLKTIFSLEEFVTVNRIEKLSVSDNIANLINNYYVGFLTTNNEFITFRDITNTKKYRYNKYNIVPDLQDTVKIYSIPNKVDILSTDTIYINMAEGVFDILGVYYHLRNKELTNNIYAAVCGAGYLNALKHYIDMGFIGNNIVINIYSDQDKPLYFYTNIFKDIKPWVQKINVYYNAISKDFGVPKEQIQLTYKNPR